MALTWDVYSFLYARPLSFEFRNAFKLFFRQNAYTNKHFIRTNIY